MAGIPLTLSPSRAAVDASPLPEAPLPEGAREGSEKLVSLTPDAGRKVQALLRKDPAQPYLRAAITGGGCNGLSYKLRFVSAGRKGDILVRTQHVAMLVDPKTALYLKGTVIDFSHQLIAGGFKFSNPNAKASCSCGESFSV